MQKIAQFITKTVHFFYRPFQRIVPEQLFRYAACGGGNLVLDIFLSFPSTLCITPHIASLCIVFPITLFTGFWLNKYVTFTGSSVRGRKQLIRYILVVALNLLINYVGLKLAVEHLGWYPTPSKILITLVTVVISFFAQKYYSFRK